MKWTAVVVGHLCLLLLGPLRQTMGDDEANPGFLPPVVGDYSPSHCWNFTHGNWQYGEFYSPHYPDNYSNDTECIQTLTAPRGFTIHLDFRDDFHIEKSEECKYDFLELRDGPFGYSPSRGRFCGTQHPPMVKSSSRFLWIRFKSDDSIEYQGFRAVYKFNRVDGDDYAGGNNYSGLNYTISEDEVCRIKVDISKGEGFLSSNQIPKSYLRRINKTEPLDCTWVIYAPPKHRTSLKFHEYDMRSPHRCEDSFLEIHDRTTAVSSRQKQICGDTAKDQRSLSNHFYLRMFQRTPGTITFKALFTIYLEKEQNIPCPDNMFDCGPGEMCINKTLVCNYRTNCVADTDEKDCPNATPSTPAMVKTVVPPSATATLEPPSTSPFHHMILGIVSGIILTIILVAIGVTCHQKRREDRRRKHALKQEEKNAIEMTTLLNKPSPHATPNRRQGAASGGAAAAASSPTAVAPAPLTNGGASPKLNHVGGKKQVPNHTNGVPLRKGSRKESRASEFDVSDIVNEQATDGGTFRRYLDVGCYNDDDSSPNPSTCNQIPAVVTIESNRRPSREDGPSQDKSSPRPDIVKEEKFIYPDSRPEYSGGRARDNPRRLSGDTVYSEQSDVWKPMGKVDYVPNHRPGGTRSLPREVTPIRSTRDEYTPPRREISPRVPQRSDSMKHANRPVEKHPNRRKAFTPPDSRKTYVGQVTKPMHQSPDMVRPSRSGRNPELARSYSAGYSPEMGRAYPGRSPEFRRPARSPELPRRTRRGDSPGRKRGDSPGRKKSGGNKSPDIFYSRPNRSTRQHHPV